MGQMSSGVTHYARPEIYNTAKIYGIRNLLVGLRVSRTAFIVLMCLTLVIVFNTYKAEVDTKFNGKDVNSINLHKSIVDNFYKSHKSWNTSKLGAVLFKNEEYPKISEKKWNKTFVILIWKHWKVLQNRHVFYFGSTRHNPLDGCSVSNCEFTGDDSKLVTADAILVHLHRGLIPSLENRNPNQRWIFLNDEAPFNVFSQAKKTPSFSELHNVFNWSMTYRIESDVPVPYGRTVGLKAPKFSSFSTIADIIPNWKQKSRNVKVAILLSNCGVKYRLKIIEELKKYISVDVHGGCGDGELKHSCPGGFKSDCQAMSQYLFYLVLENAECSEYMTEKLFHNAYSKGAIPIIKGPSIEECKSLLPRNSYLHMDNYPTLNDLAVEIARIGSSDEQLLKYHKWRNHFEIANEHGYFKSRSFHLCRLCEAMNYNDDTESVYSEEDLREFLDPATSCRVRH